MFRSHSRQPRDFKSRKLKSNFDIFSIEKASKKFLFNIFVVSCCDWHREHREFNFPVVWLYFHLLEHVKTTFSTIIVEWCEQKSDLYRRTLTDGGETSVTRKNLATDRKSSKTEREKCHPINQLWHGIELHRKKFCISEGVFGGLASYLMLPPIDRVTPKISINFLCLRRILVHETCTAFEYFSKCQWPAGLSRTRQDKQLFGAIRKHLSQR